MRRRPPAWKLISVPPAQGDPGDGMLELKDTHRASLDMAENTVVVARLGSGRPQIQCRLKYVNKAEDQPVFSRKDWAALDPPSTEIGSFELRTRTKGDFARLALSNKFLIIIAPVIVAILAIGPGLIWAPPSNIASSAHIYSADQLAGELSSAPGLSPRSRSEVMSLQAELSEIQASNASVMQQQSNYGWAYLAYALVVALLAILAAAPQAIDGFRGPGWKSNEP
jgi:hypothetical protein